MGILVRSLCARKRAKVRNRLGSVRVKTKLQYFLQSLPHRIGHEPGIRSTAMRKREGLIMQVVLWCPFLNLVFPISGACFSNENLFFQRWPFISFQSHFESFCVSLWQSSIKSSSRIAKLSFPLQIFFKLPAFPWPGNQSPLVEPNWPLIGHCTIN